jgi:hypothetical protein
MIVIGGLISELLIAIATNGNNMLLVQRAWPAILLACFHPPIVGTVAHNETTGRLNVDINPN